MAIKRFNNYDEYDAFVRIKNARNRRENGMRQQASVEKFMGRADRLSKMRGIPMKQLFSTMIRNNPDVVNRLKGYVSSEGYTPANNFNDLCAQVAHSHAQKIDDIQDMYDRDTFEPDNLFGLGKKNKAKRQAKKAARKAKRGKKKADRQARRAKRKAERAKKKQARKAKRAAKKAARIGKRNKGGEDAGDLIDAAEAVQDQQEAQEDSIMPDDTQDTGGSEGSEEGGEEGSEEGGEEGSEEGGEEGSEEGGEEDDTPIEAEVEDTFDPDDYTGLAGVDHYEAEAELFGEMQEGDSYDGETADFCNFLAAANYIGSAEINDMRNSDQLDLGKIGNLFKKKQGGTKVGNMLRSLAKKTTVADVVNATKSKEGLQNTVNKVYKKVENDQKKNWLKANMLWVVLGVLVIGFLGYSYAKKQS